MEELQPQIRRRKPALERKIGEIREEDTRVALIGRVIKVDKLDYMFTIDDGTGIAIIESEENVLPKIGQMVRVIGRIIRNEEMHIYAEVVQDFSDAELEYLEEIQELEKKIMPGLENALEWWSE
ncbi:replication protein RepA [Thermococci archaeon]|uniref:replication protein RepA n=1 Tax=Palaeococcus sp. (in: euryarchaeotes) TaxID=2820298 RepID=UPI000F11C070|nr:replication protein RepA [Palaeococcus sp. (in: euryarchaeotes)]MCD6558470.1 replication protein RepA [Palaeococcus sp. (in: euryarchaeotes)]RLF77305.1 MAG: replication protein RepA [Thermococci archaeon]RLF89525.1 MAG: replication protein RepA [Thermococci archaeon]